MKKYILLIAISIAAMAGAKAQEYKVNKSSGKLIINLSAVDVEGYDGKEIVFSPQKEKKQADPKAQGLRAVNGAGYTDNTGLGISVTDNGTTVEVNEVTPDAAVKILVPKGMAVTFICRKEASTGKVRFKNLEGEIEVNTINNVVEMANVSGPLSITTVGGMVSVRFAEHVKGPISIVSVRGSLDVAIPANTSANVNLKTAAGVILVAPELNLSINSKKTNKNNDDNSVTGKLGAGGPEFKLTTVTGKIYLRKI